MPKTHHVKIWPEFFDAVDSGIKPFELRKDDRHYAVGDTVVLQEWEPNTARFSGRTTTKIITHKTDGLGPGAITPLHGLSRGYCILGLAAPPMRQTESTTQPTKESTK